MKSRVEAGFGMPVEGPRAGEQARAALLALVARLEDGQHVAMQTALELSHRVVVAAPEDHVSQIPRRETAGDEHGDESTHGCAHNRVGRSNPACPVCFQHDRPGLAGIIRRIDGAARPGEGERCQESVCAQQA